MLHFLRLLALSLCLPVSAMIQAETLIFGDENYPPVIYLDTDGQPAGLLAEVLGHFAALSGEPVNLRLYPWKRAYASALSAQGGVIGLSKTDERLALFDYSAPIYDDNINVVVLKGREFAFASLEDLAGRKIGVQLGASYGSQVDAAIAAGQIVVETDQTHVARMRKLLHGRVDAAFLGNGKLGLQTLLKSDPELAAHQDRFVILERPLVHDSLYLGFAKSMNKRAFLAEFNRALEDARIRQGLSGLIDTTAQP